MRREEFDEGADLFDPEPGRGFGLAPSASPCGSSHTESIHKRYPQGDRLYADDIPEDGEGLGRIDLIVVL